MLRAQELSKTLRKVCEDGKEEGLVNILMMDDDGAILGAANPTDTSEEHCSAVLASIYNEYRAAEKCISTEGCLRTVLFNTENGKVAVRELFDDDGEQRVLLCVLGNVTSDGMVLQKKLEILRVNLQCLCKIFRPTEDGT